jgi:hypothetical protein
MSRASFLGEAVVHKRRRLIVGAAIAAFTIWVVVELVLAGRGLPGMPPASSPMILQGGEVRGSNHVIATRSWRFAYDRGELSPDGTSGTLDGIHDGIVYRKGKPYLRIDAQHVSVNLQTLDFTAVGLVHVQMLADPYDRSFDTDYVTWTNNAKLLQMTHPSYLHVGGQTLKIGSISVDFDKNEVHLGKIEGSVAIP